MATTVKTVSEALYSAYEVAPNAEMRVIRGIAMTMVHHRESAADAVRRMRAEGWAKDYPETFASLP